MAVSHRLAVVAMSRFDGFALIINFQLSIINYSSAFQFSSLVAATVVAATLVVATLGDVLFARCSGSGLRVNLLPAYLVGELAAELGGYGATQSALAVGSVQHLGGCHV